MDAGNLVCANAKFCVGSCSFWQVQISSALVERRELQNHEQRLLAPVFAWAESALELQGGCIGNHRCARMPINTPCCRLLTTLSAVYVRT